MMESQKTREKILSFLSYKERWNFGEGKAFKEINVLNALQILDIIKIHSIRTNAFPGNDGEVRVCFYCDIESDKHYFEFTVEKNSDITFCHEKDGAELVYMEMLSLNQALIKAVEVRMMMER